MIFTLVPTKKYTLQLLVQERFHVPQKQTLRSKTDKIV